MQPLSHQFPSVLAPKTIDNDLGGTDVTFGFDTAVNVATDALDRLHGQIKTALADAWLKSSEQIATRLHEASAQATKSREVAARIHDLEQRIADLEWTARHTLQDRAATSPAPQNLPAPIAAWNFTKDASDAFGRLDGHLEGGAEVRDGRLVLDGKGNEDHFGSDHLVNRPPSFASDSRAR